MYLMKAMLVSLVVLCMSGTGQHSNVIPVVNADGPTVVAFFPSATKMSPDDADTNEALSDFKLYAGRAKQALSQLGIRFYEQFDSSFRIRSGSETKSFSPKPNTPGYYFIAPDKKPHVEYGVMTDTDLLLVAKRYFGTSTKSR